jgi:hypothetical protein
MKKLCLAVAGLWILAAGSALANEAVVRTHNLEVKQRLAHLERIDVTAEKPISADAEALDAELLAILAEVEQVEAETAAAD